MITRPSSLIQALLFSNVLYGLFACAMYLETLEVLQLGEYKPLALVFIFCITVLYYTNAYLHNTSGFLQDERSQWYYRNFKRLKLSQVLLLLIAIATFIPLAISAFEQSGKILKIESLLMLIIAASAFFYNHDHPKYNLRRFGILKPFIIALVWIGLVVFFPMWIHATTHREITNPITLNHGLTSFMFIFTLCVLFDVKDIGADHQQHLTTIPAAMGVRSTAFFIALPGSLFCIISNHFLARSLGLSIIIEASQDLILTLPFVAALLLNKRRSLLFFLLAIDGLMLIKSTLNILIF